MMPFTRPASILLLCASAGCVQTEVSYFRQHGGVANNDTQPLPERFDAGDQLLWRQELAPGHSTPCVFGSHIFVTTYEDEKLATVALSRGTGKPLWARVAPATRLEQFHASSSPAVAVPACDGRRVYAFFGSYGLLCYDLDGKRIWSQELGPFQDEFGANSSPILLDDKVILNQDHDVGSFLLALDSATGERVWKVDRVDFTRSYATPVVWEVDGKKQLIIAGALQLVAYDANDGSKLWWVNGLARLVNPTPSVSDGILYVTSWTPGADPGSRIAMEKWGEAAKKYDQDAGAEITLEELPEEGPGGEARRRFYRIDLDQDGKLNQEEWQKYAQIFAKAQNRVLAIRPGGSDDVTETHVNWHHPHKIPFVSSPVVYRGVLYMVKDGGILTGLDAKNGTVLKEGRAQGKGKYIASMVAGDDKVYLADDAGMVTVLKAGREWDVLSSHDFKERIVATPVIADGQIYLRTDEAMYCFGLR
jgi:outer membrane protein assembly factor BamB